MTIKIFMVMGVLTLVMSACSEDTVMPKLERPKQADTDEDLLKDSVYLYTYGFYLWQDDLPDWFGDVRGNTGRFNSADAVLESLKTYAQDEKGNPLDRFSFLDRWGTVNAEIQQGLAGSFGFDVRYHNDTDLYIKKVDPGSPADQAGVKRGWQVLRINGRSDLSLASIEADNFDFLFNALDGNSVDLLLRKPDGSEVSLQLNRSNYQLQPILASQVYTVGEKKVGYFAFDAFVSTLNDWGNATYVKQQLDQLMTRFEGAGVEEMIVDLRYNGGGAVVTAEYLSNLLAPSSVGSGLMYTNKVNPRLDDFLLAHRVRIDFSPVHFHKTNALNLRRIYFLVTEGTASASELLINNLTPHVDVKLIGEHRTYGKPVGFFNWNILGVDLYAVSFQTFNSVGYGNYFSGMEVDKLIYDDLTKDFGDVEEDMIAEALYYVRNGSFSDQQVSPQAKTAVNGTKTRTPSLNGVLDNRRNKGMYLF
ncbi:S41 family peptidase [Parapedobacter defluvii]|nr:S41 family peptidase [Parapedobacter defluvii]